ncbi:SDR family oxidoreductase [Nocardia huaxiensis]|uniref:NAD(P)H-binding protein n=1 Tax=Nocardia huaxiensis TaxID=2755382 RepID=A0A7D6Z9F1_9NOCA|nr:NAD(P)H-binding protein [Nocardia huaxiensis]QLY30228.1 NAD(P)H-binding protein [Nocardia huaxiensis]UFS96153.1 NAD(P)H-binding protein [Nocardia huaxiensis]
MSTLVTGARGKIGQAVLAQLHTAGLPVRAASADPSALSVPAGVEAAELRLDSPETFEAALDGVTQVFLYPEPAGIDAFIAAARQAGVEHVVLLSTSAVLSPDAETSPLAMHNLAVEKALAASDLTVTVLRPDSFATNTLGWAHFIGNDLPIQHAYPEAAMAVVHPGDIADIAVAALTGDALRGRTFTVTGPELLSFREQLALVSEILGRDIPMQLITRADAEQQMAQHMPPVFVGSLLDYWATATTAPMPVADTTESLLGTPARRFDQWVREHAAAFSRN